MILLDLSLEGVRFFLVGGVDSLDLSLDFVAARGFVAASQYSQLLFPYFFDWSAVAVGSYYILIPFFFFLFLLSWCCGGWPSC